MFYFKEFEGEMYLCRKVNQIEQKISVKPEELKELYELLGQEIQRISNQSLSFEQLDALYWRDMGLGIDVPED